MRAPSPTINPRRERRVTRRKVVRPSRAHLSSPRLATAQNGGRPQLLRRSTAVEVRNTRHIPERAVEIDSNGHGVAVASPSRRIRPLYRVYPTVESCTDGVLACCGRNPVLSGEYRLCLASRGDALCRFEYRLVVGSEQYPDVVGRVVQIEKDEFTDPRPGASEQPATASHSHQQSGTHCTQRTAT